MKRLMTKQLGEIEYADDAVITFEEGVPGFEDAKEFVLIFSEEVELPFHYLQCINRPEIAFVITSPFFFVENYDFNLSDSIVEKMGIKSPEELYVYSIVTIPKKVQFSTINLTAPVIINTTNRKGMQVVLEEIDDINHPLFTKKGEEDK